MKRVAKVAISLPDELLRRIDQARRGWKVSRSEYFRRAAQNLLDSSSESDVDRYIRGYETRPETRDEVKAARDASTSVLASEPWD